MKSYLFLLLIAGSFVFLSCERPPELPVEPRISFNRVEFKDAREIDTLVVYVDFEDGDGDLGLSGNMITPPFHPFTFLTDENGDNIFFGPNDTYNDRDWFVRRVNSRPVDTIAIEQNPDHFNFIVDVLERQPNGTYEVYDFYENQNVPGFNGRFPVLRDQNNSRALVGTIRYGMQSRAWSIIFGLDSLKLRVMIKDRALNQSNVVESQPFTLQGVKRN
jgi:hypothetical protein